MFLARLRSSSSLAMLLMLGIGYGFVALPGCGTFTLPGGGLTVNREPWADAGPSQNVEVGSRVRLNGYSSTDSDDDPLSYSWVQRTGPSTSLEDANSGEASFLPTEDGYYEFALTVTDGRGGSDTSVVQVIVGDGDPKTCPRADAGVDQTVNEGNAVTLRGGNSADPSGVPLSYEWFQLSGPQVSINGVFNAEPRFAAPQVNGAEIYLEFELTVSNEQGCSDTDTVLLAVRDRDEADPCNGIACEDDGSFCNGIEICDQGFCKSTGNPCDSGERCDESSDSCEVQPPCSWDEECDDYDPCTWDSCAGSVCSNTPVPCEHNEYCDPATGECVPLPCQSDNDCAGNEYCDLGTGQCIPWACQSNDDCEIGEYCDLATGECLITALGDGPIAEAGEDQTVDEGASVYLNGGDSSDPDGWIASYEWVQIDGSEVILSSPSSQVSFTAPSVSEDTTLTFELTVTDSDGLTATDTVSVIVSDLNGAALAAISIAPETLTPACKEGKDAPSQTFAIRNAGGGTLFYTLTVSTDTGDEWLSVSTPTGESTGEVDSITVDYDTAGLAAGVYSATITIADPAASNPTETVQATLTVVGTDVYVPTIELYASPMHVIGNGSGGAQPKGYSFEVRNRGDAILYYSITADVPWIQFDPPDGATGAEWNTINVSFEGAEDLPVGIQVATIMVSDPKATNSPQTIPVTLTHHRRFAGNVLDADQVLDSPGKLAVDAQDNLYVVSKGSHQVHKFFPNDDWLMTLGSVKSGLQGQFDNPTGVAVDALGNVYVCDEGNDRVQKFSADGTYLLQWGIQGSGVYQFDNPQDIAVDFAGNVYVADTGNGRIQKFNPDGDFILQWPTEVDTRAYDPKGMFINAQGSVFVALGTTAINEYTTSGDFVRSIPLGQLSFDCHDIVTDDAGNLFAVGYSWYTNEGHVRAFSLETGIQTGFWSNSGDGDGQHEAYSCYHPSITLGANGMLYTSDGCNDRIIKWAK